MQYSAVELIHNGIDMHTHSGPSMFARIVDDFELANQAREAGMRAVLIKAHEMDTTLRARLVSKIVQGIDVLGGLVLNHFVGGLNPGAVDLAIKTGTRMVWMPTISAAHHIRYYHDREFAVKRSDAEVRPPREPISILDDRGRVRPEVHEIVEMLAAADVALGTAHLSADEIDKLATVAREAGLRKLVVTHADHSLGIPVSQQVELARQGAFIEKCYITTMPVWGSVSVAAMAGSIRQIGAERCILTTDYGMKALPTPVEGISEFAANLLANDVSPREIATMLAENPGYLMGLDGR